MIYNSRTAEFRADLAELLRLYRTEGFDAADRQARVFIITRNLDAAQTLTLTDGFRRAAILGLEV